MSSKEMTFWQAWFAENPQGEERADIRSALAASAIVNEVRCSVPSKHRPKLTKPSDFMPFSKQRSRRITDPEAMVSLLKAMYPPDKV